MENKSIVDGLLTKRAEILKVIADLERHTRNKVRKHRESIARLDQAIELFDPTVMLAKRHQTMGQRSVIFVTGELTWRCQTALRGAKGQPVTADQIPVTAVREKHLDLGDGELRQDITRRFIWRLNRLMGRKAPANHKEICRDRRLAQNQNGKRKVVVVMRELDGRAPGPVQFDFEQSAGGYRELAERLNKHGLEETETAIAEKLARGTSAVSFFLAVLTVLELDGVTLAEL